jgi:hypothetical protein
MRKSIFIICLAAIVFMSCDFRGKTVNGNGNHASETRNVGNLTKIKLVGAMDVFVAPGAPSVKVEGDENILQYIETRKDGDWLEIKTRDHFNIHSSTPIKVFVTAPSINAFKVTGSGNLTGDDKFSSNTDMSFSITGSGNITANINAPAVSAGITGSGNMYIKGETRSVDIQVTGSGNYDSPDLKAENASVKILGSGDASLFADGNLNASIAGSGDVKYRGNAKVVKHIAGSGSIINIP